MAQAIPTHERAFALSCDLLKLFLAHGIRPELRDSLTEKQRAEPFAFQAGVLARNIAGSHVKGWQRDQEYQDRRAQEPRT